MNKEEKLKLVKQGREMLRPNWNDLDSKDTPKGQGEEYPDIVKNFNEDSLIIKLKFKLI